MFEISRLVLKLGTFFSGEKENPPKVQRSAEKDEISSGQQLPPLTWDVVKDIFRRRGRSRGKTTSFTENGRFFALLGRANLEPGKK